MPAEPESRPPAPPAPSWWRAARALARRIDAVNGWAGRLAGLLALLMIAVGAFNTLARYGDRYTGWQLSSNAYLEAQWYLFSLVFLLAGAYTLREGRHVRVDVLYGRLSARRRAWIDLLGTALLLLPFSACALWLSWPSVRNAWAVREGSPDPGGLARYPIKTMILVAFGLLILQGLAEAIRCIGVLRGDPLPAPGDHDVPDSGTGQAIG